MKLNDLFEARRNADVNTIGRGDVIDNIASMVAPDLFISFTEIPKLGINPRSPYSTPIGIYTYPLNNHIAIQLKRDRIPYAGDANYINVIRSTTKVVNLDDDMAPYTAKLGKWMLGNLPIDTGFLMEFTEVAARSAAVKSAGGIWWNSTRLAAIMMALHREGHEIDPDIESVLDGPVRYTSLWTRIMLDMGVYAVVDYGNGIIHSNEPRQAVFFTTTAFKLVDRVENPRAAKTIDVNDGKQLYRALPDNFTQRAFEIIYTWIVDRRGPRHCVLDVMNTKTHRDYTIRINRQPDAAEYMRAVASRYKKTENFSRQEFLSCLELLRAMQWHNYDLPIKDSQKLLGLAMTTLIGKEEATKFLEDRTTASLDQIEKLLSL